MDTLLDNVIGFATIIAISILCLGGVLEFQSRIIANTTKYNALMEKAVNLKKILYTTRRLNHAEITNLLSNASANSYILCKINNSLELEVVDIFVAICHSFKTFDFIIKPFRDSRTYSLLKPI